VARTERNWIQTASGRQFWPLDPRPEDIFMVDVAHALAMKCRYTGHCLEFYSVAQHSVLASLLMEQWARLENECQKTWGLWGLLHDATEAYLPDVARPVKRELIGFKEIEDRLAECVAMRFGLPWPMPDRIAEADLVLLATEYRDLMASSAVPWGCIENVRPMAEVIEPLPPNRARAQFLGRWREFGRKGGGGIKK
jgi:hypothetical protein